jgi:hypothetical protein
MVPWLALFGLVLAPSAAFLFWGWQISRRDMSLMRATETTPAAHVGKLEAGIGLACLVGSALALGSATWLARGNLAQVNPPQEVLQGGSVW